MNEFKPLELFTKSPCEFCEFEQLGYYTAEQIKKDQQYHLEYVKAGYPEDRTRNEITSHYKIMRANSVALTRHNSALKAFGNSKSSWLRLRGNLIGVFVDSTTRMRLSRYNQMISDLGVGQGGYRRVYEIMNNPDNRYYLSDLLGFWQLSEIDYFKTHDSLRSAEMKKRERVCW
jgi:hypothetical protein